MRIRSMVLCALVAPLVLSSAGCCRYLCPRYCPPKERSRDRMGLGSTITRPTVYNIRRNGDKVLVGRVMQYVTNPGQNARGWVILQRQMVPDQEIDESVLFIDTTLTVADDATGLSAANMACTLHNTRIDEAWLYDWASEVETMNPTDHVNHWNLSNGRACQ